MIKFILPIGGALLMIVLAVALNDSIDTIGVVLAGFVGFGIGYVLYQILLKIKTSIQKSNSE